MTKSARFEPHSHTHFSNLRLLDCICKPKELVDRAIDLGLSGIAITDHECLSAHMELNLYSEKIREKHPDFKIALGNEIYLVEERVAKQQFYHFILIAKNANGHKALRELSSVAWMNSYKPGFMERVPTLYEELDRVVEKYPNSLIATTACLGGFLSSRLRTLNTYEAMNDKSLADITKDDIDGFIKDNLRRFGNDFYIECAPGCSLDQILVNKRLAEISQKYGIKMVIGSDAHFLKKEDRFYHKSFLTSRDDEEDEREVDDFYEFSYLQSNEEIIANLKESGFTEEYVQSLFDNSFEIWEKIENFSLSHKQTIPKVDVIDYPKVNPEEKIAKYPVISSMYKSDNIVDRYWVNQCVDKLKELDYFNDEYLSRLEEEADIKATIGEKLETNMFAYPVTLQHYVDLFWNCGSIVGAGRGSSCSGLNHYLLGVTQLNPIKEGFPFWR